MSYLGVAPDQQVPLYRKEYISPEQTLSATRQAVNHGLGVKPSDVRAYIVCKTAEHGYTVGQEVELSSAPQSQGGTDNGGFTMTVSDTQIVFGTGSIGLPVLAASNALTAIATPANWKLVVRAWADPAPVYPTTTDYILIQDQQTSGTNGGPNVAGIYVTRVLNTIVNDSGGHASLASNTITLTAGTYRFKASAPAWYVLDHKIKLRNTSDAIDYIGTSEYASITGGDGSISRSFAVGEFTISTSKSFVVQHWCTNLYTNGFGNATSSGDVEVYAQIELWKVR